jgi:hypothetical protein
MGVWEYRRGTEMIKEDQGQLARKDDSAKVCPFWNVLIRMLITVRRKERQELCPSAGTTPAQRY